MRHDMLSLRSCRYCLLPRSFSGNRSRRPLLITAATNKFDRRLARQRPAIYARFSVNLPFINHSSLLHTMATEHRKTKNEEVQDVLATIADEGDQLDAIANIRGWYGSDNIENAILKQYMNSTLSLEEAVSKLADPIDQLYTSGDNGWSKYKSEQVARSQRNFNEENGTQFEIGDWGVEQDIAKPEGSDVEYLSTEGSLWCLWFAVMHTARKISWQDEVQQTKLLDFVKALKARPDPPQPEDITIPMKRDWMYSSGKLWSNLSMMGPSFRECWNDSPGCGAGWSLPEVHAWVNANAFVARVAETGLANYWNYGIWALRDAFEQKPTSIYTKPDRKETVQDLLLTTAAVWILIGGKDMWAFVSKDQDFETHYGLDADLSKLPQQGDGTWTRARWNFWKEKLEALVTNDELADETKRVTRDAVKHMQEVET